MSQSASFCQTEDRCPLRSSAGVRARKLLGLRYEVEALGLSQGKLFLPLQQALECLRQVSHCHQGAREEISAHLKIEFVPQNFPTHSLIHPVQKLVAHKVSQFGSNRFVCVSCNQVAYLALTTVCCTLVRLRSAASLAILHTERGRHTAQPAPTRQGTSSTKT